MQVINLISGPRNISTALMYSFAQRDDCKVVDEPFYGYYLKNAPLSVDHPSHDAVIESMECEEAHIVEDINANVRDKHFFVKGMAHHFLQDRPKYLLDWNNVILIRHPKKLIASFSKVIENPTLKDIGIKKASELFLFLKENGKTPIVIDSDELMLNPENYLRKLCHGLNIPFQESMLSWPEGGIPEDGVWAPHWYSNVHRTTGFQVQQQIPVNLEPHLGPLLAEATPYYETLKNHILKND
jgi:hypothetical protein